MEAVKKKLFWGIFISILSFFAMSHNANAVDFTFNLNDFEQVGAISRPRMVCNFVNSSYSGNPCIFSNTTGGLVSGNIDTQTFDVKSGDILTFDFIVYNSNVLTTGETASGSLTGNIIFNRFVGPGYTVLSVEPLNISSNFDIINYYLELTCRPYGASSEVCSGYPELSLNYHYYSVYRVILRISQNNSSFNFPFTTSTNSPFFYLQNAYGNYSMPIYFDRFILYRLTETQENKEVEQKTQNAVNDSQAAGGSSSSDAQTGTTGLLNAITGAVNVISAARPTNCKINGNMGNLDIGQLDLCANPAPAFVQTIGSLILILMCVPLAISLFNRFIAIFRSFQS